MIQDIETEIQINAAPERVWQVLTSEGLVDQWLGCMEYAAEIGHVFYMQPDPAKRAAGDVNGATHCRLMALDPPHRMTFSWFFPGTPETEVEISIQPTASGSQVRLLHRGWDQFDGEMMQSIRDGLAGGWSSHVLPGLKRVAEA